MTLQAAAAIAQAVGSLVVAGTAFFGLQSWKKQKQWDRHADVASGIMASLFEFEERFAEARAPLSFLPDTIDIADQDAVKKYQIEERSQKLQALGSDYNALVQNIARAELWKLHFCADEMKALKKAVHELAAASRAYYSLDWRDPSPNMKEHYKTVQERMWGERNDAFGKVVGVNAEQIREACRKLAN